MAWSSKFLCVAITLLPTLVLGGAELAGRDFELLGRDADSLPDTQQFPGKTGDAHTELGEMPLDGRSLIESWLGKRATCVNSGYAPCLNSNHCCPSEDVCCPSVCCKKGQNCCLNSSYCADPGDKCCSWGTCPSGWNCCGTGTCYPVGGECCSDGNYCTPGNKCYIFNGLHKCCTDAKCTAYVSNGITSTAGGGASATIVSPKATTTPVQKSTPPITSSTPLPTAQVVGGDWVWTLTWHYYSYWWVTTIFEGTDSAVSTSTWITTTSLYTVHETNSASASATFSSFWDSFDPTTPAQAKLPPSPTQSPANSAAAPTKSSAGSSFSPSTGSSSGPGPSSDAPHMKAPWGLSWVVATFVVVSSGVLMVWL